MNSTNQHYLIKSLMMVIVGMLCCSNVVSAFVVGNTAISMASVISLVFLIITIIFNHGQIVHLITYITSDLKWTFAFIILSVIQVVLLHPSNFYQWLTGVISVMLFSIIIIFIVENNDYMDSLYYGLMIGVIINFLFSVYALILYNQGIVFDVMGLFPNTGTKLPYIGNAFRPRGLFKEQGHLMRFLSITSIPVLLKSKEKSKVLFIIMLLTTFYLIAFSGSATIAIFLIGLFLYIFIAYKKDAIKLVFGLVLSLVAVFILLSLFKNNPLVNKLLAAFQFGFVSIFDTTGSNGSRIQGFQYAIDIIKQYPVIGCGWNNFTKEMINMGVYGINNILGSYSGALSMIAELGVFSTSYFYFLIQKSVSFISQARNNEDLAIGVSLLMYFVLFCTTDYTFEPSNAVLIAIACIKYRELKNGKNK